MIDPPATDPEQGQISAAHSGAQPVEPLGGADAVPGTPDNTPTDHDAEDLARPDVLNPRRRSDGPKRSALEE